jgi:multiple sugar transport system ATP-binding protein
LTVPLSVAQRNALTGPNVVVGVRPESFATRADGGLDCVIDLVEELGSESYLYCTADGVPGTPVVARTEGLSASSRGDSVSLTPMPASTHLFDAATGLRLPEA